MSSTMLKSKGGRVTKVFGVEYMLCCPIECVFPFVAHGSTLSWAVFPELSYFFCFGAADGSTFLINSLIFYFISPSVGGSPLLLIL